MEINNMLMLNVGHAKHDADWNFRNVNSPFTRIYYVTKGNAEVEIDSIWHKLVPGNMYIIPAFTKHTDKCDGVFEHFYVHIYEDVTSGLGLIGNYDFPVEIQGTDLDMTLFTNLCDHNRAMALKFSDPKIYDNKHSMIECVRLNRSRPLYDRLEAMGIIYQLLGRFMRFATPKFQISDARISNSLKTIIEKEGEFLTVDALACDACMSKDHFIRLFRQEVGDTPAQFIINSKMTKAKLMLASENMSIKDVAYNLGYYDISYFTRLFKKHTDFTPRQYRNLFNIEVSD